MLCAVIYAGLASEADMRLYYDLHIHSALSPCADDDMTPNNIVNMAKLKGLDVIALSDHNCAKNVEATAKVARDAGVLFILLMRCRRRTLETYYTTRCRISKINLTFLGTSS